MLDREGDPGGEIRPGDTGDGGFRGVRSLRSDGEHLVLQMTHTRFDREAGTAESEHDLAVADPEGTIRCTFAHHRTERDFQHMTLDEAAEFAEYDAWALAPGGPVYTLAARERYAIKVYGLDAMHLRTLERPFPPRRRTAADKERVREQAVFFRRGQRHQAEGDPLDTDRTIASLRALPDGRLLVENCRNTSHVREREVAARFDVIGADDTFIEELTLTFRGFTPAEDRLLVLDGEHFLLLLNHASAVESRRAGFGGSSADAAADLGDAEPLEVVLVRLPAP
jgi:hypothetical protein